MKKSIILFILYFVLNVNASTCDSGHRQSPVDIRSIDLNYVWIPKLNFESYGKEESASINNTGTTVKITGFNQWSDSQPSIYGGALSGKYKLNEIHFHWGAENSKGSEHTIGSISYPVEIHFVHQKVGTENMKLLPSDGLAVIGIFLTVQQNGSSFSEIEIGLRQIIEPNTNAKIEKFTINKLLPSNPNNFYTYEGSLTTGTCDETVIWTVLTEPVGITQDQLNILRSIKSGSGKPIGSNYRAVQPLNGRRIKYRTESLDKENVWDYFTYFESLAIIPQIILLLLFGLPTKNRGVLPYFLICLYQLLIVLNFWRQESNDVIYKNTLVFYSGILQTGIFILSVILYLAAIAKRRPTTRSEAQIPLLDSSEQ